MANYVINDDGSWSKKKKKNSGTDYIINSDGSWSKQKESIEKEDNSKNRLQEIKNKRKETQNEYNKALSARKKAYEEWNKKQRSKMSFLGKVGDTLKDAVSSKEEKEFNKKYDNKKINSLRKQLEIDNYMADKEAVKNKKVTAIDKITEPLFSGINEANKSMNTTVQKIGSSTPISSYETPRVKLPDYGEMYYDKVRNNTKSKLGKVYQDLTYTTGNMLPSIVMPGTKLALGTTAVTSFGSSYNQAKREGKTESQSTKYGIAKAGLETGLQKVLGGLSSVYGKSALGKVAGEKVDKALSKIISSPVARKIISEAGSEFSEEYLQEILDPVIRNITLDENNKFKPFTEEALYSGMLGALNSGLINSVGFINSNNSEKSKSNIDLNENNYNISDDLRKEILLKTNNAIKKDPSIQMVPIDEILSLKTSDGGYRIEKHIKETQESIKKNGILNPIELEKDGKGNLRIYDGNHRLEIAKKFGLEQVPVKYDQKSFEKNSDILYNKDNGTNIGDFYEKNDTNSNEIINNDVQNENINASSNSNQYVFNREKTTKENDSLFEKVQGYNDKSPSTPRNGENIGNAGLGKKSRVYDGNVYKTKNEGLLENSSFFNVPSYKNLNPNEISKLTKENANTTPNIPSYKTINKNNNGDSHFFNNIETKTNFINEEAKTKILSDDEVKYYDKVTNRESLNKALDRLNTDGESETLNWFNKDSKKIDPTDVAEGWILLKQYQDSGNYDAMVQVAKKMREMGTQAGQTVQAFNIMERLTPEGMVKYAQSELQEAYDQMVKNKSREWIEKNRNKFDLTPDETKFIIDKMQELQGINDEYQRKVNLAEIQKVITDKLPPSKGAGIKAWMRISMLFNPKTQVRNVLGNAVIAPVNYFSDLISSSVDKQISKKTGVRTTGKANLKNYSKGFKTGLYQSYNDFKKGINTRDIEGNRFEIGEGKSFNDNTAIGKKLNKVDNLLSFMLDAGDRGFYEASFTNSINNQLILNNTNIPTQEMIDIATSEALQRTWQDNNGYTTFVMNIRKGLNKVGMNGYGLGDILIPFAKTPANLTKALVDYSPAGMIKTINEGINLKRSLKNGQYDVKMQHQFVQDLGKATAGTMLYMLGYALAKAGITSGESDDDKDVSNFMKNTLGISNYSIKIGNKSFSYDWAQPVAGPLAITANIVKKNKEGAELHENILSSLDTAGNILLEQSFLDSINTVFSNNDGIATGLQEAILELPSRSIPTLSKQIVDLTDKKSRTSFEYNKPLESAINQIKAKIPGLSKTLAPVKDTLGRDVERYGGKNNIFNVFLNPANVNSNNVSESAKEIYHLYKQTGDKTIMPRVAPYYENNKGKKIQISSQQRADMQKISGEIAEENIKKVINNERYKKMSDSDKVEVINDIVNYAYVKAKKEVLNINMSKQYNKLNEYIATGGNVYDYYANREEINYSLQNPKSYKKLKEANFDYYEFKNKSKKLSKIYESSLESGTKKASISNQILGMNLSDKQKAVLYSKYYNDTEEIINSKIPMNAYLSLQSKIAGLKGDEDPKSSIKGKTISGSKKQKVLLNISQTNGLNKTQKLLLTYLSGYSVSNGDYKGVTKESARQEVFKYVDSLNLGKKEKTDILEKAGYKIYKNGRIGW